MNPVNPDLKKDILQQLQAGASIKSLCKKHKIAYTTIFTWKKKAGIQSDAPTPSPKVQVYNAYRTLEAENAKLRKVVSEMLMDNFLKTIN